MDPKLTFNLLPIVAMVLSLAAWYVPFYKDWYEKLTSDKKQTFMLASISGIGIAVAIFSYFGLLHVYSGDTWQAWVFYPACDIVIAAIANSSTYSATDRIFKKITN